MDVWNDESEPGNPLHRRIRRFKSWKDAALFAVEILGGAVVIGSFAVGVLTSMGFTFSGSGQQLTEIRSADVVRDTAIAKLQRQNDVFASRLDDIFYIVCEQTKRNQPGIILPRSCK
jgi:hypothetical protein